MRAVKEGQQLKKLNLTLSQSESHWVTLGQWHQTHTQTGACTLPSEFHWQLTKSSVQKKKSKKNCWTSSPSTAVPLNPAPLKGTMGEMFGLWSRWTGPLSALLRDRMQWISVKPQRRIKLTQLHCHGLAISSCHATLGPTRKTLVLGTTGTTTPRALFLYRYGDMDVHAKVELFSKDKGWKVNLDLQVLPSLPKV